jgi:hypothetical protein
LVLVLFANVARSLEHLLSTGSTEYYPLICADVTATFTVLSSTINAIRSNLESRDQQQQSNVNEILLLITRLQRAEQTKLQLTAAVHLERMRSIAQQLLERELLNNRDTENHVDDKTMESTLEKESDEQRTISSLLGQSISSLREKIVLAIGEINDILEELKYLIADADEE